jgi:RNA polymerase sigma factor (TIGR02999 family)
LDPARVATLLDTLGESDAERGDVDRVVPFVYEELRELAHRQLAREHGNRTLQTTALVHEAYLKLVGSDRITERGRAYFFAAAARAVRQVLVDHARKRNAGKRGGSVEVVTLDQQSSAVDAFAVEVIDLDRALEALAERNPRHASVVECRFFGGLSIEETAAALDVSPRTVKYDWALARAWLYDRLHGEADG